MWTADDDDDERTVETLAFTMFDLAKAVKILILFTLLNLMHYGDHR